MMHPREALKIVEAIESTTASFDYGEDHARGVVAHAFNQLGLHIAEALGVPSCTCHYGHDERYGAKDCPRRGFGS